MAMSSSPKVSSVRKTSTIKYSMARTSMSSALLTSYGSTDTKLVEPDRSRVPLEGGPPPDCSMTLLCQHQPSVGTYSVAS